MGAGRLVLAARIRTTRVTGAKSEVTPYTHFVYHSTVVDAQKPVETWGSDSGRSGG